MTKSTATKQIIKTGNLEAMAVAAYDTLDQLLNNEIELPYAAEVFNGIGKITKIETLQHVKEEFKLRFAKPATS